MKKVLIVDDEEDIREVLAEFCELLGAVSITASSGLEGFQIFQKEKFDLIITDLKMPDMDGFKFVDKIRKEDKNVPIVIVSGFIDEENKNKIFRKGANFYLEKPFKIKDLKEIFNKINNS